MGSYAGIIGIDRNQNIKDPAKFAAGIEEIFRQGGMMNLHEILILGRYTYLLAPIRYDEEDDLVVTYNYFENRCWEEAAFNRKYSYVRSEKIGDNQFAEVMTAAYIYESLNEPGISAVVYDTVYCLSSKFVGWINYILHSEFQNRALDPWSLFVIFHYTDPENCKYHDWEYYKGLRMISTIGYFEVKSVMKSTEEALTELNAFLNKENSDTDYWCALSYFKDVKSVIQDYKANSEKIPEEQIKELIQFIRAVLKKKWPEKIEKSLEKVFKSLIFCDSVVFILKTISEEYNKDFWELWEEIKDVAIREESVCWPQYYRAADPVTTEEFLKVSGDDRIFWWTEDNPVTFSKELESWFSFLKEAYQNISCDSISDYSFSDIVNLVADARSKYNDLYTFETFFVESIEHLHDRKYVTLWKLYESIVFDTDFQGKALDLFVPPKTDECYQKEYDWQRKRACLEMLRRFNALAANVELRKKIFDF